MVTVLLENPDQLAEVKADPTLWRTVFEETVRWVSPIGMYPRQTTKAVELGSVKIEAGARIGVVLASANRDEAVFENPTILTSIVPRRHMSPSAADHTSVSAHGLRGRR